MFKLLQHAQNIILTKLKRAYGSTICSFRDTALVQNRPTGLVQNRPICNYCNISLYSAFMPPIIVKNELEYITNDGYQLIKLL